jgi:uncharacterized protein
MKLQESKIVYSPSDVITFVKSPFASWMDRQYLENPESLTPDEDDAMLTVLARRGNEHEHRYLTALKDEGHNVCEVHHDDQNPQARTIEAINQGTEVIFQARLAGNGFAGWADFLFKQENPDGSHTYEIWDTKLAKSPKPYFIIQLCCYAEMYEAMTGRSVEFIGVVLGAGEKVKYRLDDFKYYYRGVSQRFMEMMETWPSSGAPAPEPSGDHGRWNNYAKQWLLDRDHLSQVANISKGQIGKLANVGITTMSKLAEVAPTHVKSIGDDVLAKRVRQAQLQVQSKGLKKPLYEILPPPGDNPTLGLAALPPASELDVYFDMEGYPSADDWLEYLFGAVYEEDGKPVFVDWWAHDSPQEKAAFEQFIDWAYARWRRDPGMHIYHYAAYETTAMKNLMGKYGTREDEVDNLLRNGVFVDLYAVVRNGLLVGEPSYSIKNLEHIYMQSRQGAVVDAAASMVFYDQWCESGEPGNYQESPNLKAIRDYNEDDCVSTWLLAKWLREEQAKAGIAYLGRSHGTEEPANIYEPPEYVVAAQQLALSIFSSLPETPSKDPEQAEQARINELLGWLLEFHRRADKPMWWAMFERMEMTTEQLWEDMDCIGGILLRGDGESIRRSVEFPYSFDPNQDTKLHEGNSVYFAPDLGIGATISKFDPEGKLSLLVSNAKLSSAGLDSLPGLTSLLPNDFVSAKTISDSIYRLVEHYVETDEMPSALNDFLHRNPPRLLNQPTAKLVQDGEDIVEAATRIAANMQATCLCIQGPPGTGKTYTAARVIIALIKDGKRVGVTSNSHKAIINLIRGVCAASIAGEFPVIKVGGDSDDQLFDEFPHIDNQQSQQAADNYGDGLIGGTAWFFSRENMQDRLDYLFIDEAGQVSLANLVGMSASTNNIVLMGDQMQLGQPIQGSHPGESGQSILEYYLHGHATIPEHFGIFLGTSWRMHPGVCSFISEAVYEGRLKPESHTKNRIIKLPKDGAQHVPVESGILFVPVEHEGNVQGSDEEVAAIVAIVKELIGRDYLDAEGNVAGQIDIETGIIIVTPYNMQVRKLKNALPNGARVASVDKFQGQEAPIVIVSMCASPGEFGSRGMQFILDKNRLNVAISRAQSLAIVVGDPRLDGSQASNIEDMRRMNLYCWLRSLNPQSVMLAG